MKIKKFIIPAVACVAAMTSCNGTPVKDVAEAKTIAYNAAKNTATNLDNITFKVGLSNVKGSFQFPVTTNGSGVVKGDIKNVSLSLEGKAANLQKMDYDETTKKVSNPIVGSLALKAAVNGSVTGPAKEKDGDITVSVNDSIDSIKAYLNFDSTITEKTKEEKKICGYKLYGDLSSNSIPNTVSNLVTELEGVLGEETMFKEVKAYLPLVLAILESPRTNKLSYSLSNEYEVEIEGEEKTIQTEAYIADLAKTVKSFANMVKSDAGKEYVEQGIDYAWKYCVTESYADTFNFNKHSDSSFTVTATAGTEKINKIIGLFVNEESKTFLESGSVSASISANDKGLNKVSVEVKDVTTKDGAVGEDVKVSGASAKLEVEIGYTDADTIINAVKNATSGTWYDVSDIDFPTK